MFCCFKCPEETTPLLKEQNGGARYSSGESTRKHSDNEDDGTGQSPLASPYPSSPSSPSQEPKGATGSEQSELEQEIEKIVNKALGDFVKMIKKGISELNIPSLDPIDIPGDKDINISAALINVQGNFSDFKVAGLSLMTVPELALKERKATATTTTKLEITGKYSLNGRVSGFVSIDSKSTFKCTIGVLKATIGISYKDPKKLKAVVELKSTNVEVKLNDAAAAKPILSKLGGPIAKFVEDSLGPTLQTALQKIIDQHVNDTGSIE